MRFWTLYRVQIAQNCACIQSLLSVSETDLLIPARVCYVAPFVYFRKSPPPLFILPPADPHYLVLSIFFHLHKFSSNTSSLQLLPSLLLLPPLSLRLSYAKFTWGVIFKLHISSSRLGTMLGSHISGIRFGVLQDISGMTEGWLDPSTYQSSTTG